MASSSTDVAPIVSRAAIKVIAESVGIARLKDEVADALAPDVEYRLRDIVQEALKFQKHGRRDTLTTEDINYALRLRNCEPLYGFASPDPPRFCRALTPGLFYLEDPELNLADLLAEQMPPLPIEPSFTTHWLAINGVQPHIPQNPAPDDVEAGAASRKRPREEGAASGGAAGVTPLAKHALTDEEQKWLDRVTTAVQNHKPNADGVVDAEAAKVRA
jgi:transcription initiation factor TFIID subunit 6